MCVIGYGDSTKVDPTERDVVKDVIFIYNWVAERTGGKIFVWGHSLGTGLSLHALSILENSNKRPWGLILESPFNNMKNEIQEHPVASVSNSTYSVSNSTS